jgi:ParB family chromosome partitioning protein
MTRANSKLGTTAIGVKHVATGHLKPNPYNPRMLFDAIPREVLRQSIERVGILVPLTVYWDTDRKQHVILDGQRRWMCARDIGLKTVPVNQVAEPSLVQNIVTMFQIHQLREEWELMPTALKVELLMKEIGDRNNARLAELTGLDDAMIVRCKKLISYDKAFQDMMLDPNPEKRIKPDFFVELYVVIRDRDVISFDWFSRNKFIKQMLAKYLDEPRTLKAVTDFRIVKQHITSARRIGALVDLSARLKAFAENHDSPLTSLEIQEASVHAEATGIFRRVNELNDILGNLDVDAYYGEAALWQSISRLIETIKTKLREANSRT